MEYRNLGTSGLRVPVLSFGTGTFGVVTGTAAEKAQGAAIEPPPVVSLRAVGHLFDAHLPVGEVEAVIEQRDAVLAWDGQEPMRDAQGQPLPPVSVDGDGGTASLDSPPVTDDITFRVLAGAGVASGAWNEIGVFNAASGGTMLKRVVRELGTKPSGQIWALQIQLEVANEDL